MPAAASALAAAASDAVRAAADGVAGFVGFAIAVVVDAVAANVRNEWIDNCFCIIAIA